MGKVNSIILGLIFENFDVVLCTGAYDGKEKRALYIDGRFYFTDGWCYTTQDSMANTDIYKVKKILRPNYFKGDAFRFLHGNYEESYNMKVVYEASKICSKCGQFLPTEE